MSLRPFITSDERKLMALVADHFPDKKGRFEKARKLGYFNCFNFTFFMLGISKEVFWDNYPETKLDKTNVIKAPKKGDIVAYYDGKHLIHTAIMLSKKLILHKPGGGRLEVAELRDNIYYNTRNSRLNYEFRRPVVKKKKVDAYCQTELF